MRCSAAEFFAPRSGEGITLAHYLLIESPPVLNQAHALEECYHLLDVGKVQLVIRVYTGMLGDGGNVGFDIVFVGWSPSLNNGTDGCASVVADVSAEQYESGTNAILHSNELLKVGVSRVGLFAQPYIADADVQWVAVAESAWQNLLP